MNTDTGNTDAAEKHYSEQKKTEKKKHVLFAFIYMKFLKRQN